MDNLGGHSSHIGSRIKSKAIRQRLAKRLHLHLQLTPASWIEHVSRFFAEPTERQIRRGVHRSATEPERAIAA
jgi:hypothetical protein